jgi:hypothetical protein
MVPGTDKNKCCHLDGVPLPAYRRNIGNLNVLLPELLKCAVPWSLLEAANAAWLAWKILAIRTTAG